MQKSIHLRVNKLRFHTYLYLWLCVSKLVSVMLKKINNNNKILLLSILILLSHRSNLLRISLEIIIIIICLIHASCTIKL